MNIVVLAGGLSPERDVSLSSGCMVANALIANGHRVLLADVYMGLPGVYTFNDAYEKYKKDVYEYRVPETEPDLAAVMRSRATRMSTLNSTGAVADAEAEAGAGVDTGADTGAVAGAVNGADAVGGTGVGAGADTSASAGSAAGAAPSVSAGLIGECILPVCADADMTFIGLHGDIGENGRLQAVFDIYGVKYTGSGYEGSLIAMDKPLAKGLMRLNGVRTPDSMVIMREKADGAFSNGGACPFELPCVIKPCGCGSSVGVSMVERPEEFDAALRYAFKYEDRVLVERKVTGREFSVGVLGGEALPPIEIIPNVGFYDYKNKYQPGAALEICPPHNLPPGADKGLRGTALKVHDILRLGDYSRIDVIMGADGEIYCLEANTLPGMTPTSLLPQEAAAAGLTYGQLCEKILMLALNRK